MFSFNYFVTIICITTTLLAINFVGYGLGQRNLEKCPNVSQAVKPINMKEMYGAWYAIRIGPCMMDGPDGSEPPTPDCAIDTYWADAETEEGIVHDVMKMKMNGTIGFYKGVLNTTFDYSSRPELPQANTYEFTAFGMKGPLTFLDSDAGRSWMLGYSCTEFGPSNVSASWFISSRLPYMDPKLEQSLVQRIQKLSPTISSNDLMAVGHTDCF